MRIAAVSGYGHWGELDPALLWNDAVQAERQIGGGETAMLSCAREWARAGHEVLLFCPCKPGRQHGIDFIPVEHYTAYALSIDIDVMVAWDFAHAFRFADRVNKRVLAFQLNHADVGVFCNLIDEYWHPSNWHRDRFCSIWGEIPVRRAFGQMTNGVDVQRFQRAAQTVTRKPGRVIYSSSPDRGLHHLLRFWPRVHDAVPHAELHVYYEVERWVQSALDGEKRGIIMPTLDRAKYVGMAHGDPPPGVVFHGGVSQGTLARAQVEAEVLCYPCDPVAPTEGFSMTVLEGITAGCSVLISNADAFSELWGGAPKVGILPLPVQDDAWVTALVSLLRVQDEVEHRVVNMFDYTWEAVGQRQLQHMRRLLA